MVIESGEGSYKGTVVGRRSVCTFFVLDLSFDVCVMKRMVILVFVVLLPF